ncbi:MAG TPA: hypothetical protein VN948_23565 [Terriglobales bacterium]|nr:hypothetical protein [Terriglobales bacterium]
MYLIYLMRRTSFKFLYLCFWLTGLAAAQAPLLVMPGAAVDTPPSVSSFGIPGFGGAVPIPVLIPSMDHGPVPLVAPVVLPRMAPELALQVCRGRSVIQTEQLASYSATTLIRAQLPDTSQSGEYEVQRHYLAPRTLAFKALRFTGDAFVKTNVIIRLLQSEVDHVQKDDPAQNAISPANYRFSYKGTSQLEGRLLHVYQLKPRQKRAGLFKGRIYVDAYTGSLVRAEGRPVKSPSLFIKKIDFVQDYADIGPFTFPVHIHSEARARIVGRAIVDVYQRDYEPVTNTMANTAVAAQRIPAL